MNNTNTQEAVLEMGPSQAVEQLLSRMSKEHREQQLAEFRDIHLEHYSKILWKAKLYTKRDGVYHEHDAEDVAGKTFENAWESFYQFDASQSDIKTWLFTVCKNAYMNWKRDEERQTRGSKLISLDEVDYEGEDPGTIGLEIQEALSDANWYQSESKTGRGRVFLLAKDFKQESPKEIKEICEKVCSSEEIEIINLFNSGYSLLGIAKLTVRTKKQVENIVNRIRSKVHREISL